MARGPQGVAGEGPRDRREQESPGSSHLDGAREHPLYVWPRLGEDKNLNLFPAPENSRET